MARLDDNFNSEGSMTTRINRRHFLVASAAMSLSTAAWAQDQPADQDPPLNGEAILIVFPDYPIDVLYGYETNLAGHAGVLLIKSDGTTKYFEFGRYPPGLDGRVRNKGIPNAAIGPNGKATAASLLPIMRSLSDQSGDGGRIRGAYFINMNFDLMEAAATANQPKYSVGSFNCGHYAEKVIVAGNSRIDRPIILNPLPNNIVDEYIEEGNAELLWKPGDGTVSIGAGDESDAKV